ncbi:MAG TPA: MFS transporter [Stellaceae bacterium]|nr:MFS transporter [Stellaceae bacterium]
MPGRGKLHYAWVVVGVAALSLLVAAGVRATPGVLIVPLQREFHWSRATISFAVGVNILLYGLVGPFAAALMDRWGLRRTLLSAVALVAAGVALTLLMRATWQLVLLWGVVVGLGTGVPTALMGAVVAERWFAARRGLVLGFLTASAAAGQMIFLPPMAAIVSAEGWRTMTLWLAVAVAALLPIVALLMRERPQDLGLRPYGETGPAAPRPPAAGNPVANAFQVLAMGLGRRDFWLLGGSFFVCGLSTNGLVSTHLIPACIDHGIPAVTGASLLAAMGMLNFIGVTLSGWLSDRWNNRALLFWYYGLRGLSLVYLPFAFGMSFYGLSLFSVFYGLDWFATVPPTVRLAGDTLGPRNAPIVFGWLLVIHQLGGAIAAYLGGIMRTELGTYLQAFLLAGMFCFAAALMVLFIGRGRRSPEPMPAGLPAE